MMCASIVQESVNMMQRLNASTVSSASFKHVLAMTARCVMMMLIALTMILLMITSVVDAVQDAMMVMMMMIMMMMMMMMRPCLSAFVNC